MQVADYHGVAIIVVEFREGSRGESAGDDQGTLPLRQDRLNLDHRLESAE